MAGILDYLLRYGGTDTGNDSESGRSEPPGSRNPAADSPILRALRDRRTPLGGAAQGLGEAVDVATRPLDPRWQAQFAKDAYGAGESAIRRGVDYLTTPSGQASPRSPSAPLPGLGGTERGEAIPSLGINGDEGPGGILRQAVAERQKDEEAKRSFRTAPNEPRQAPPAPQPFRIQRDAQGNITGASNNPDTDIFDSSRPTSIADLSRSNVSYPAAGGSDYAREAFVRGNLDRREADDAAAVGSGESPLRDRIRQDLERIKVGGDVEKARAEAQGRVDAAVAPQQQTMAMVERIDRDYRIRRSEIMAGPDGPKKEADLKELDDARATALLGAGVKGI